jgi:hypothetical protein
MKRCARVLLWVVLAVPGLAAQDRGSDFLEWREGAKLRWDDFRGPIGPADPSYQGAASHLSIAIRLSCTNNVPDLHVSAEFDRNRSWARPNMTAGLLEHEQVHFDIAELYARRTRVEWREVGNPCANAAAVRAIADRNSRLAEGLQDVYDEETHHGTRPGAQTEWAGRLRRMLDASIND